MQNHPFSTKLHDKVMYVVHFRQNVTEINLRSIETPPNVSKTLFQFHYLTHFQRQNDHHFPDDIFNCIFLVLSLNAISQIGFLYNTSVKYTVRDYFWLLVSISRMPTDEIDTVHDDVIKRKHFPRYWPFVRGIHRFPANSPHERQWRGALMVSLICVWINGWVNNREAGDLRRYRVHYDVTVMHFNSAKTFYMEAQVKPSGGANAWWLIPSPQSSCSEYI